MYYIKYNTYKTMMSQNEASSELCTKHLNAYVEELQSLLRAHNVPFPTISEHRRTLFDSSQSACDWELKEKIGEGFRGTVCTKPVLQRPTWLRNSRSATKTTPTPTPILMKSKNYKRYGTGNMPR